MALLWYAGIGGNIPILDLTFFPTPLCHNRKQVNKGQVYIFNIADLSS